VLLAGVNDHPDTIRQLCHDLVKIRVKPYYLYQCDLVEGSGHFRTTVAAGLEIMEALRGHTSGYAIPTYVVDLPGGGGKVPVLPNYLISQAHGRLVFRNFEGYISTYTEPTDYQRPKRTQWMPEPRPESGQRGVSGLLAGERMTIKPHEWQTLHERNEPTAAAAPLPAPTAHGHDAQPAHRDAGSADSVELDQLLLRRDVEVAPEGNGHAWTKVN
jgi:lysine 2,3-aminomutase